MSKITNRIYTFKKIYRLKFLQLSQALIFYKYIYIRLNLFNFKTCVVSFLILDFFVIGHMGIFRQLVYD